jgi:nucleotide-binding universal stress UspA family protein
MKKIILPTDFSENSYNAISYALHLFKEQDCTFYLLNTYTPAVYQAEYLLHSPGQIGLGDIYQSNSLEQLQALKVKLETEFNNGRHTFIVHAAFNTLPEEVREFVEQEKADLVIMGTQGATGAQEILLGTHTVHVLKQARCPLIMIPSGYAFKKPKEVLFPTDYEVAFGKLPMHDLLDLALNHHSSIEVVHVATNYELSPGQKRNKTQLQKLLHKVPHNFHDLPSQEIITAINAFQQKTDVHFLVMVKNKHSFFERLFVEPVIRKIAFHVNIPFMVIPG